MESKEVKFCKDSHEYDLKEFTSVKSRFGLEGRHALVTGAAGGIGHAVTMAFAEVGADVVLMDIEPQRAKLEKYANDIREKYGRNAYVVTGDVSDQDSVRAFVAEAAEKLGTIDLLHNNAGIVLPRDNVHIDVEKWKRVIDIDLVGMFLVAREAADVMIAHKHGGTIVNTASNSAHIYIRNTTEKYGFSYGAAKAGVINMTKGMAAHYSKYGIRVNSISPGVVLSGIHADYPISVMEYVRDSIPVKRFGTLDEIASAVVFLASDMSSFMVGADLLVDGGQTIN